MSKRSRKKIAVNRRKSTTSEGHGPEGHGPEGHGPEGHGPEVPLIAVDLRTAPPVQRMRLVLEKQFDCIEPHITKLFDWTEKNPAAQKAYAILLQIVNLAADFDAEMAEFEATGWSPARKSYTAKTNEGDRVAILEDMRESYAVLMDPELMGDLLVVKKYPGNKGGGLIVVAKDGSKMKVSISHVVKMSSAA